MLTTMMKCLGLHRDDQYSELYEVPVKYLKAVEWKGVVDHNNVDCLSIKFVKEVEKFRVDGYDKLHQEKLKAVETLKARVLKLYRAFWPEDVSFLHFLWITTTKTIKEGQEKYVLSLQYSSLWWTRFDADNINISRLVDLASTELVKIKAYNSKTLGLLEAGNLNEWTLWKMSNHYSSFYKGIRSLNMKIDILRFHLTLGRSDLKTLVDSFLASVECELRQYEEQLETTRFKVFDLAKKQKTDLFGLRWLPNCLKGPVLSTAMKPGIWNTRRMLSDYRRNKLHNNRVFY